MASRLTKQLVKECQRNPKKAAMLGVLALVALWFWAPLAMQLLGSGDTSAQGASAKTPLAAAHRVTSKPAVPHVGSPPAIATAKTFDWKKIAESIERDPLMRPLALAPARNPFEPSVDATGEAAANVATPPANAAAHEPPDPESAGLKLSGTSVGGSCPIALINGRPCQLGRLVVADNDVTFEVVRIEAACVTLRCQGKLFELKAEHRRGDDTLSIRPRAR